MIFIKKFVLFFLFVGAISLLTACSGNKSDSKDVVKLTDPPTSTAVTVAPAQASNDQGFKMPVQGVRPVAVMIDNQGSRPLPQGGLEQAQVIYEMLAEGGISRLMPMFWNQNPTMLGPVRSSRHYFLDYAMENDAIYVHFGWSPKAKTDISNLGINSINGVANAGAIFTDLTQDKNNWQDSYTTMEKVMNFAKEAKFKLDTPKPLIFTYNQVDTDFASGNNAQTIDMIYSKLYKCGFVYDGVTKLYKRIREGVPQMDRVSKRQLTGKNIIIQYVKMSDIYGDDKGRQELYTIGNGDGFYITNGKVIDIKWAKDKRDGATTYKDKAGVPISLNLGQTWIQIVPTDAKITIK